MPDANAANPLPLPRFSFSVTIPGIGEITCEEVSGLDHPSDVTEYRAGDRTRFRAFHMPGLRKASNVTLKRGCITASSTMLGWLQSMHSGAVQRANVSIRLLDEDGQPKVTWTLHNAWPSRFTAVDLKADGNEVAMESIELMHEGLELSAS